MAGSSFFALFDDIASLLDDIATLTKVATQKTAGVLGDDLALNAQQVAGVSADRELPVVWAVAKGSAVNKLILVPAALAISALAPWAVMPLLMLGGLFLCFEGVEKLAHKYLPHAEAEQEKKLSLTEAVADPTLDMLTFEKEKIKGAIRTDFVLSAEIIVITLGTVATASMGMQLAVLSAIAVVMTIGVYGLVAGIVKLDDLGLRLTRQREAGTALGTLKVGLGKGILRLAPMLMKFLSIAGTVAMFLVGGSIITHGVHALQQIGHDWAAALAALPFGGPVLGVLFPMIFDGAIGVLAGAIVLLVVKGCGRVLGRRQ